jgi:hypothetical protein
MEGKANIHASFLVRESLVCTSTASEAGMWQAHVHIHVANWTLSCVMAAAWCSHSIIGLIL